MVNHAGPPDGRTGPAREFTVERSHRTSCRPLNASPHTTTTVRSGMV